MSPFNLLILVLVVALLVYAVILGQIKTTPTKPVKPLDRQQVALRWATIEAMLDRGGLGLRNAILEADKLLDHTLRSRGYRGQTMAERLRAAERDLSHKQAVWRAHKLRNTLAHEVEADVVASQVKEAIGHYKRALKDLRAL